MNVISHSPDGFMSRNKLGPSWRGAFLVLLISGSPSDLIATWEGPIELLLAKVNNASGGIGIFS